MTELQTDMLDSPIGRIVMVFDGDLLCALDYADCSARTAHLLQRRYQQFQFQQTPYPYAGAKQLSAYLAGDLDAIATLPVSTGGTPFQQTVWKALRTIPAGTTLTYGELANQLGNPKAYRAVGLANALNPIAIVVPCHRLVGTDGALTGYAGGLKRKQWLLQHEGVNGALLSKASPQS